MAVDWLISGVLAFGLAAVNLVRALLGKKKGWQTLVFLSLSCGAIALLAQYRMVYDWAARGDWSALADVVPGMFGVLCVCTAVGIVLNAAVLILNNKGKKED